MVTGRKIPTGGSWILGEVNRGPIFIGWLEIDRDGLLYVLTHRSSHGTLMGQVLSTMARDPRASIEIFIAKIILVGSELALGAMQGHVLANAELIGTYQKGDR